MNGEWRINMKIIVAMMTTIVMTSIVIAENENITHITYQTEVDQDYGFYRVIDMTTLKSSPYENNTLTINVGDTVIWENDATPDEPLTIISKDNLWDNKSAYLRWNYQKFNYTFNQSGTYEVYIREYPRERHQIILVTDMQKPVITVTPIPTVTIGATPVENVSPISTDATSRKNGDYMSTIWTLIIIIGIGIFMICRNKKK